MNAKDLWTMIVVAIATAAIGYGMADGEITLGLGLVLLVLFLLMAVIGEGARPSGQPRPDDSGPSERGITFDSASILGL